jgi:hydrogenase 3 maturation protease
MAMKKYILLGIGNELRGDDGIGPYVADNLEDDDWLALNCGTVPENFTSVVKHHKPELVLIVDATEMGLQPGQYRRLSLEKADTIYLSTHALPLSYLATYLGQFCSDVVMIGIQPKCIEMSQELSVELKESAKEIIEILKQNRLDAIPLLHD